MKCPFWRLAIPKIRIDTGQLLFQGSILAFRNTGVTIDPLPDSNFNHASGHPLCCCHPAKVDATRWLLRCVAAGRARWALLDAYVEALGETLAVPYSTQVNPPLWEAGHIGWFQDFWIARNRQRERGIDCEPEHARPAGRMTQADSLYNSSQVAHASRWLLPLPNLAATRAYLAAWAGRHIGPARRQPGNRCRAVFLSAGAVP